MSRVVKNNISKPKKIDSLSVVRMTRGGLDGWKGSKWWKCEGDRRGGSWSGKGSKSGARGKRVITYDAGATALIKICERWEKRDMGQDYEMMELKNEKRNALTIREDE